MSNVDAADVTRCQSTATGLTVTAAGRSRKVSRLSASTVLGFYPAQGGATIDLNTDRDTIAGICRKWADSRGQRLARQTHRRSVEVGRGGRGREQRPGVTNVDDGARLRGAQRPADRSEGSGRTRCRAGPHHVGLHPDRTYAGLPSFRALAADGKRPIRAWLLRVGGAAENGAATQSLLRITTRW